MTISELNEKGIKCYPDNDGGLWYRDLDGTVKEVEENGNHGIQNRK